MEIEYTICTALICCFYSLYPVETLLAESKVDNTSFPHPPVFQPLVSKLALSKMCFPLLSLQVAKLVLS